MPGTYYTHPSAQLVLTLTLTLILTLVLYGIAHVFGFIHCQSGDRGGRGDT